MSRISPPISAKGVAPGASKSRSGTPPTFMMSPRDYWDFLDKYGLMEINENSGKPRFSKKGRAVIKSLRDCFVGDRLVVESGA